MRIFKKMIGLCLLMLVAVLSVQAQTFESMVKRFEKCPKAEYTHVGPFLMRLAKAMAPQEDLENMGPIGRAMLGQMREIALLDLEACSEADKAAFRAAVANWVPEGYTAVEETEQTASSDAEVAAIRCFVRAAKKSNYELIIVDVKATQCIYLNGDLTEELIQDIISQDQKAKES